MTKNQTPDEQIHDDAEEALTEQTPVRVSVAMLIDPITKERRVDLNKTEMKYLFGSVVVFDKIREHSTGDIQRLAAIALMGACDLEMAYNPDATETTKSLRDSAQRMVDSFVETPERPDE